MPRPSPVEALEQKRRNALERQERITNAMFDTKREFVENSRLKKLRGMRRAYEFRKRYYEKLGVGPAGAAELAHMETQRAIAGYKTVGFGPGIVDRFIGR